MAELENYLLRMAREVSRRNTRLEEELRDLRSNLEAEKTALETEGKAKLKRQQTIKRMLQDGECQAKDLEIEIQQLQESLRERQDWLKNVQQSNEDLEQEHRQLERSIEIHRTREEQVYRKHNTQENELRRSFEKWAAPYQSAIEPFASTLPEATPAPEPRNPNQAANHPRMSPAAQDDRDETIILPHSNLEDDNEDSQPRRSDRPTRTSRPANEPDRATSNQHRKRGAAETDNSGLTEDSVPQKRQRLGSQQRTIDFEEVYQNGSAEEKHFIIEWPKETGKWYILLCEEHHKHFHKHPLQGAAKHLSGRQHGNLNRGFDNAIEQLGILVQNCTEEKAKLNNQVLRDFLRAYQSQDNSHQITQGEEPPRESHAGSPHLQDDTGRQSSTIAAQAAHPDKHEKAKGKHEKPKATKSRDCPGIINPDAGKVYRAIHEGKVYTCLILPLGSFQSAGVEGNLYNSDLAHEIPVCYDKSGGTIVGWAAEYQDRRKSVRNRRFPILFFVDLEVPDEGHIKIPEDRAALMWMRASKLRSFDLDDPECRNAKGYEGARKFCKRMGLVGSQAPTEGPGRDSNQSGEHSSGRATSNGPQLAEEEQDMIIVLPSPSSPSSTNMASEADEESEGEESEGEESEGKESEGEESEGEESEGEELEGEESEGEDQMIAQQQDSLPNDGDWASEFLENLELQTDGDNNNVQNQTEPPATAESSIQTETVERNAASKIQTPTPAPPPMVQVPPATVPNNNRHSQHSSPAFEGRATTTARFVPVSASELSDREQLSGTVPSTGPQIPPTHQDPESVHSLSDVAMEVTVHDQPSEPGSDERTGRSGIGELHLPDLQDETLDGNDSSLPSQLLRQQPSTAANSTPANLSSRVWTVDTLPMTGLGMRQWDTVSTPQSVDPKQVNSGAHGPEMSQQPRTDPVSTSSTSASIPTPVSVNVFAAATSTVPPNTAAQRPPVRPLRFPVVGPLSQQSPPRWQRESRSERPRRQLYKRPPTHHSSDAVSTAGAPPSQPIPASSPAPTSKPSRSRGGDGSRIASSAPVGGTDSYYL